MTTTRFLFASGVVVALFASVPRSAQACSEDAGPPCSDYGPTFAEGGSVPAATPALPVEATSTTTIELVAPDGAAIEFDRTDADGYASIKPKTALTAASGYKLKWQGCDTGLSTRTFTVTSAPLPTAVGELEIGAPQRASESSCGGPFSSGSDFVFRSVKLASSSALTPYLPFATVSVKVDGEYYTGASMGRTADRMFAWLKARCVAGKDGFSKTLTPGVHKVAITVQLAGASAPLPTLEQNVELSCGDAPADAGAPPTDTGAPDDGGTSNASDTTSDESTGCSVSVGGRSGSFALAALVGLAIAATRRRR